LDEWPISYFQSSLEHIHSNQTAIAVTSYHIGAAMGMATPDYFPSLKGYYEKNGGERFQQFNFGIAPGTMRFTEGDYYQQ
jgi:hypothetical protein